MVFNFLRPDHHVAGGGVDNTARLKLSALKSGCNDQRLDARARLEDVSDSAIAIALGTVLRTIIRVVGRLVHHGEHFTRLHIEDHDRAGNSFVLANCRLQGAVCKILDPKVDAGAKILTLVRRPDTLHIFDRATEPILEHAFCAGLARQPVIERELETLLPAVINVGKTDQVTGNLARRIVTAILALHVDTWQIERQNLARFRGIQVSPQVQKFLVHAARYAPDK